VEVKEHAIRGVIDGDRSGRDIGNGDRELELGCRLEPVLDGSAREGNAHDKTSQE
jgi:hypothetical protein